MRALKGIAVSPGYESGNVFVYEPPLLDAVQRRTIEDDAVDAEYARFAAAIDSAVEEVSIVRGQVAVDVGEGEASIFDAHVAMLRDPSLQTNIHKRIQQENICVEAALAEEVEEFSSRLAASGSDYMKELSMDVMDVGNRLLRHLSLALNHSPLADLPPGSIIVAQRLMPSETVGMNRKNVMGIATECGGATSHAAILARSLGIPAVTGLPRLLEQAKPGTPALLDGAKGALVLDPSNSQRKRFVGRRKSFEQSQRCMREMEKRVCKLKNGTRIKLLGNINHVSDVGLVGEHNLDGIGLFRTELLYLPVGSAPSSAVQCRHYKRAAMAAGSRPVAIRTFDFAADKHPSFLSVDVSSMLELRGLRLALHQPRLFKSQLRAIVRAAREYPNIQILFPMVTGWWELKEALSLLQSICDEEKLQHRIPVAAMIETPAAIFALKEILEMVDFVSIGCSDLAQYTLAMERSYSAQNIGKCTLHPSLLRAIQQIVETAAKANCPVSLCGEAASDPLLAAIFIGLGVREISVSPARATVVRYALRNLSLTDAKSLARCAVQADPATVMDELLHLMPAELCPIIAMEHGHSGMLRSAQESPEGMPQ